MLPSNANDPLKPQNTEASLNEKLVIGNVSTGFHPFYPYCLIISWLKPSPHPLKYLEPLIQAIGIGASFRASWKLYQLPV